MWASIMYHHAKSGKPVWPVVIVLTLLILLAHLLTSQMIMEPIVIEVHKIDSSREINTILLEMPRPMANALRHNQRQVSRDLQFLKYVG